MEAYVDADADGLSEVLATAVSTTDSSTRSGALGGLADDRGASGGGSVAMLVVPE